MPCVQVTILDAQEEAEDLLDEVVNVNQSILLEAPIGGPVGGPVGEVTVEPIQGLCVSRGQQEKGASAPWDGLSGFVL